MPFFAVEAMQADRALGDRHRRTALDLVSELSEDLADQCGNIGTAEPYARDADHRGAARTADGQQPMEVRVQGYDRAVLIERERGDLGIARAAVPDVGNVKDIETVVLKVPNSAVRKALVQQESDHAAPKVMIWSSRLSAEEPGSEIRGHHLADPDQLHELFFS